MSRPAVANQVQAFLLHQQVSISAFVESSDYILKCYPLRRYAIFLYFRKNLYFRFLLIRLNAGVTRSASEIASRHTFLLIKKHMISLRLHGSAGLSSIPSAFVSRLRAQSAGFCCRQQSPISILRTLLSPVFLTDRQQTARQHGSFDDDAGYGLISRHCRTRKTHHRRCGWLHFVC